MYALCILRICFVIVYSKDIHKCACTVAIIPDKVCLKLLETALAPTERENMDFNLLFFLRYLPKLNAILKPNVLTSSILVLINKHSSGFRLLVVVVIYIVGGLAFTIGYKKHQGRERIPNSKQWAELPGLVKV